MANKRIKLKNATGDYLEPYTTNVPDASTSSKGLVQLEETPTAESNKVLTSGTVKAALDNKLDKTGTAAKATADASGNNIASTYATKTELSGVEETANSAKSIADGKSRAVSYASYEAMITAVNGANNSDFKIGDNIYITVLGVPDLWIYSVEETSNSYEYSTDEAIVSALSGTGTIQVGYYKVAALETQKVDLNDYVPTTRKVNGKALSGDITLTAADVGALTEETAGSTYATKTELANKLDKTATAVKATADANGNNIASTYAKLADIISYEEMA